SLAEAKSQAAFVRVQCLQSGQSQTDGHVGHYRFNAIVVDPGSVPVRDDRIGHPSKRGQCSSGHDYEYNVVIVTMAGRVLEKCGQRPIFLHKYVTSKSRLFSRLKCVCEIYKTNKQLNR